MTKKKKPK